MVLYDFGLTKDRTFYYVMELLDGIDLQTIVERFGPMPASSVVKIMQGVAAPPDEAHHAWMIHRDSKPRNVVVAKIDLSYDFFKLLYFGRVKTQVPIAEGLLLTIDGVATGTPAYLPPEIAMGDESIDGRADLYSLSRVAYYLLTGKLVFPEPTPTAMAHAHEQKTPDLPSSRLSAPVAAGLEAIVMNLLEKKPGNRIASASHLLRTRSGLSDVKEWCADTAAAWWIVNLPDSESQRAMVVDDNTPSTAEIGLVAAQG